MEKLKVYGSIICIDCRNLKAVLKSRGIEDAVMFYEITESTTLLKEFLSIRDHDAHFYTFREGADGAIGIPCFVSESHGITLDPNEAFSWIGQAPIREEELPEKRKTKHPEAVLTMRSGAKICIELLPETAPNTVDSFISAVEEGVFDGHVIERIVPEDWIDVSYTGFRKKEGQYLIPWEYQLHPEIEPLDSSFGCVCMGGYGALGQSGCEFFFPLRPCPEHKGLYPVFGIVTEGKEELLRLKEVPLEPVLDYPDPSVIVNRPLSDEVIEKAELILNGYRAKKPVTIENTLLPECWTRIRKTESTQND